MMVIQRIEIGFPAGQQRRDHSLCLFILRHFRHQSQLNLQ